MADHNDNVSTTMRRMRTKISYFSDDHRRGNEEDDRKDNDADFKQKKMQTLNLSLILSADINKMVQYEMKEVFFNKTHVHLGNISVCERRVNRCHRLSNTITGLH